MPFTPLDPPQAQLVPFITQQQLTDWLGRNVNSDNGAAFAIEAACSQVRTVAEQRFNRGTSIYQFDGTGTDAILLPDVPINSAGSVVVGGGTITDYMVNSNGILLRGAAGVDPRPVWPLGRQNVQITVDHGYDVVDIPENVRQVALNIAARIIVQGVATEEQLGTQRIKYAGPATDLTKTEKLILRKYKR